MPHFSEAQVQVLIALVELADPVTTPNNIGYAFYPQTLEEAAILLKPGGKMAIFYSFALWEDPGAGPESLQPIRTPLGQAIHQNGLRFQTWDFTQEDYRHTLRKKQIAEQLKADFEAEGNRFLYENKVAVAEDTRKAIELGTHVRYLYLVDYCYD